VVETGLLLMAVWWAWIFTAWVTNWLDPERAPVRIMLFVVMVVGMVMTMSIPKAFGERGLIFALAFVAIQLGRSLFTAWAMRDHPFQSRNFIRISAWFAASGVLWIAGGLAEGGARLALWGGAIALEYLSPALGFWTPGMGRARAEEWDVEGGHLAERCALFTIIALGESILVMGATTATLAWTPMVIAAFLASFAGSLAMWWIYFSFTAEAASEAISHAKDPGRVARAAYTYIHLLPIAGIIVTAVADEWTIHHPTGPHRPEDRRRPDRRAVPVPAGRAAVQAGGVSAWAPAQVVGLLALAALARSAWLVSPLVLSIATTVVLLGVSVREGLVHERERAALDGQRRVRRAHQAVDDARARSRRGRRPRRCRTAPRARPCAATRRCPAA
jgi:low temperature requirement protein LtrA